MSVIDPGTRVSGRIAGPQGEAAYGGDGSGWVLFAAIIMGIVGVLNAIYGIAAIGSSSFFLEDQRYIVEGLNTWGWIALIVGIVQLFACASVIRAQQARGGALELGERVAEVRQLGRIDGAVLVLGDERDVEDPDDASFHEVHEQRCRLALRLSPRPFDDDVVDRAHLLQLFVGHRCSSRPVAPSDRRARRPARVHASPCRRLRPPSPCTRKRLRPAGVFRTRRVRR